MDSEYAEVRTLLSILAPKVADCYERLIAQGVSNALYGLQSMSSEHPEVRKRREMLCHTVLYILSTLLINSLFDHTT